MQPSLSGIVPVMLTPFTDDDRIDWDGYERLIEWYIAGGAQALFAVCQSSEMFFLSLEERIDLARATMRIVDGRVPVVASGHISDDAADQRRELVAVADTGVDGVVFVTNRLAPQKAADGAVRAALDPLMAALPGDMPLGLYECPAPYRRLLTDDEIAFCAHSGRFAMLKDVSCDLATVERRLRLAAGTPLAINNASAAVAWPAIRAGAGGFCGVMLNFHPDLYRWLLDHGAAHPALAEELAAFLYLAAMSENLGYPTLAKAYHQRCGTFASTHCRNDAMPGAAQFWQTPVILDQLQAGADRFRSRIAGL